MHALVLVVVMPFYAQARHFRDAGDAPTSGGIFLAARQRLADRQVLLGCARPAGHAQAGDDAYAVMAGLDGIAFPAEGAVAVAKRIGRPMCSSNTPAARSRSAAQLGPTVSGLMRPDLCRMTRRSGPDVMVVGLGPAGASAAAAAARAGAQVVAHRSQAEAGLPVQCAEFVPAMIGRTSATCVRAPPADQRAW